METTIRLAWIPVIERVPDTDRDVWGADSKHGKIECYYCAKSGKWKITEGWYSYDVPFTITHWMDFIEFPEIPEI